MDRVARLVRGATTAPWALRFAPLARGYAAILFCESPWVGVTFLALTLAAPNVGVAGLLAALLAGWLAKRLGIGGAAEMPSIYNSLLVGLSLGALYRLDGQILLLILIGTFLTVMLTQALSEVLARYRLPVLSLPFVLVAWATWLAARALAGVVLMPAPAAVTTGMAPWLDGFFTALGWFFFQPYPLVGLLLFAGVVWSSRYLAILALCGYAVGEAVLHGFPYQPLTAPHTGFNFMLAAMAVGGVFTVPGRTSFLLAMAGSALAALFTVVLVPLLAPYRLPVFTMPFLLATFIVLAGLAWRRVRAAPQLLLDNPALPEVNYEHARLAAARLGEAGSVPLLAPFRGEWHVYQSFGGRHTHQPPWQHALDFFILAGGRSFQGSGARLDDYHCFGAMVTAPANGQVVACRDDLPDNVPGEVDTLHNWGNYLQIRLVTGYHVLLAHLHQGSLVVRNGDWVAAGQPVATCGSSGRSPQPHLHLHVQADPYLGSATVPFHLCGVISAEAGSGATPVLQLSTRPMEMAAVTPVLRDDHLAAALHLPVGRCLSYQVSAASGTSVIRRLHVELTLLGQFRLVSDNGASVAFEESPTLLAFYDRDRNRDAFLDMWLLALGLIPLSRTARRWQDTLPGRVLPLTPVQRLLLGLRPLGALIESTFERSWDAGNQCWHQEGRHRLQLLSGVMVRATTVALVSPFSGCRSIVLDIGTRRWVAELSATGLIGDNGIPSWSEASPVREQYTAVQ
jgi:urea transporter/murein DD-endopeptidase MepM/ murein hydrolase activator NlpD